MVQTDTKNLIYGRQKEFDRVRAYTYTITRKSDGLQYHGVRYGNVRNGICACNDLGIRYFTSGMFKKEFKTNPQNFDVKLRWTFPSSKSALLWESMVNGKIIHRSTWANAAIGKGCADIEKLKIRREAAFMKKYGVPHNMMLKSVRDKRDETLVEMYGTTNTSSTNVVKNRVKKTCLLKFGVEFSYQAPSVKENIKKSLLSRYGVDNPRKSEIIREEMKTRSKEKYGCEHGFQREDIKEKIKEKRIEMYVRLAKMTNEEFSRYLLSMSQEKSVQNQKITQRAIGEKLLESNTCPVQK